jgi:hypothetical protein
MQDQVRDKVGDNLDISSGYGFNKITPDFVLYAWNGGVISIQDGQVRQLSPASE